MDRRRRMLKKRRRKQRIEDENQTGIKLIFAEGYAAIKGTWKRGDEGEPPKPPDEQP